jgi:antitoxin MazE
MTKATISKWGNSIAIRLPKAVTEERRLRVGDVVNLDVRNGKATIEKLKPRLAPRLEEMVAEMDRLGWENEPDMVGMVLVDQIRSIDKAERLLCHIEPTSTEFLQEVRSYVSRLLGLEASDATP